MADCKPALPTSAQLAADRSLFPVWDPDVPFPSEREMPDPAVVTHITVERAKEDGYHYLHEATVAYHAGRYYAAFANHPTEERGDYDELIRGCVSDDAVHWSEPEVWLAAPAYGATSFNHPLLVEHDGTLYGFFVSWREAHYPCTEIFTLNDDTGEWVWHPESALRGFVPFCTPQKMPDGNWVLGGEHHWYEAAVAVSDGDDFLRWRMTDIPRPGGIELMFPESAVVVDGERLLVVCRPLGSSCRDISKGSLTAAVAESPDCGKSWSPLKISNFPLSCSAPFAGKLSTGQNYLITNSLEAGRTLLSIAVTGRNGGLFRKIYAVRRGEWPAIRYYVGYGAPQAGQPTMYAYPGAIEREGKLYVIYSVGKEDCALTVIPVEALECGE